MFSKAEKTISKQTAKAPKAVTARSASASKAAPAPAPVPAPAPAQLKPSIPRSRAQQQQQQQQQQEEERKQDSAPKQGFTLKPSSKYMNIKTVDPFAAKPKNKQGSFAYVYDAGGIPCRVNHGAANLYLQWNRDVVVQQLSYDPLLVTCIEGLIEEGHPYDFISFAASKEMLTVDGASEKVNPIVAKLVWPLRTALQHKNDKNFDNALTIMKHLSECAGPNLNPHVKNLLVPIVKRLNDKKYRDKVYEVLRTLEENGGQDVLKIIKSSVPTYTNM